MVAARQLRMLGQKVFEMATPCGGIFTGAEALGLGGIQNLFDPAAQAGSRFGLLGPQRFEDRQNVRRCDAIDRKRAQGLGVDRQGHFPLRAVLVVSEACRKVRSDIIGQLAKGRDSLLPLAIGNRVYASLGQLARLAGGVSCLFERDQWEGP